uniref:Uncharacterized protein n=1 Tax=Heterorhabditis bacteriophora TaxID=37862 RepID=A0A1I7XRP8_HETBA
MSLLAAWDIDMHPTRQSDQPHQSSIEFSGFLPVCTLLMNVENAIYLTLYSAAKNDQDAPY